MVLFRLLEVHLDRKFRKKKKNRLNLTLVSTGKASQCAQLQSCSWCERLFELSEITRAALGLSSWWENLAGTSCQCILHLCVFSKGALQDLWSEQDFTAWGLWWLDIRMSSGQHFSLHHPQLLSCEWLKISLPSQSDLFLPATLNYFPQFLWLVWMRDVYCRVEWAVRTSHSVVCDSQEGALTVWWGLFTLIYGCNRGWLQCVRGMYHWSCCRGDYEVQPWGPGAL